MEVGVTLGGVGLVVGETSAGRERVVVGGTDAAAG